MGAYYAPEQIIQLIDTLPQYAVDIYDGILSPTRSWWRKDRKYGDDFVELLGRLGSRNILDFLHIQDPSQKDLVFDLARYEDRIALTAVLALADVEPGLNVENCKYSLHNEVALGRPFAMPPIWWTDLPYEGVCSLTYLVMADQDIILLWTKRAQIAQDTLNWQAVKPMLAMRR